MSKYKISNVLVLFLLKKHASPFVGVCWGIREPPGPTIQLHEIKVCKYQGVKYFLVRYTFSFKHVYSLSLVYDDCKLIILL